MSDVARILPPPNENDARYGPPTYTLYEQFTAAVARKHGKDIAPDNHLLHNHHLGVMRECHAEGHPRCVQTLFVLCPKLCEMHTYVFSRGKLFRILRSQLGI